MPQTVDARGHIMTASQSPAYLTLHMDQISTITLLPYTY